MKNYLLFLITILLLGGSLSAQHLRKGGTFDLGTSFVEASLNPNDFKSQIGPSATLSGFLEHPLGKNAHLHIGLSWVLIGSGYESIAGRELVTEQSLPISLGGGGQPNATARIDYFAQQSRVTYLGIPVLYQKEKGRFAWQAGLRALVYLTEKIRTQMVGFFEGAALDTSSDWNRSFQGFGSTIDLGPTLGANFRLSEQWRLQANYYHGIRGLFDRELAVQSSILQATVGVSYLLPNKKEN
ncbi:MAG: hypothetical protein AAGJ82_00095 [Bacteroidota bacterium]